MAGGDEGTSVLLVQPESKSALVHVILVRRCIRPLNPASRGRRGALGGAEGRHPALGAGLVSSGMAYARAVDTRGRGALVRAVVRWLLLAPVAGLACTDSSGEPMNSTVGGPVEVPPWACVPGETQPCPCDDGLEGLMTCDVQGAGFGECDCSPGAVSQGPAPTSTGTGSGTGSDTAGTSMGETTVDPTSGSTSVEPDPSTSESSSSGVVDPSTTSGSSSSSGTGSSG